MPKRREIARILTILAAARARQRRAAGQRPSEDSEEGEVMSDQQQTEASRADRHRQRGSRRVIVGTVTSSNMDKTVDRHGHPPRPRPPVPQVPDAPREVPRARRAQHGKVGDVVEIVESRPMSKTKRWRAAQHHRRERGVADGAS